MRKSIFIAILTLLHEVIHSVSYCLYTVLFQANRTCPICRADASEVQRDSEWPQMNPNQNIPPPHTNSDFGCINHNKWTDSFCHTTGTTAHVTLQTANRCQHLQRSLAYFITGLFNPIYFFLSHLVCHLLTIAVNYLFSTPSGKSLCNAIMNTSGLWTEDLCVIQFKDLFLFKNWFSKD